MGHSTPNSTCAAHINPKPGTPEAVFVSGLRDMCCCSSSLFDQDVVILWLLYRYYKQLLMFGSFHLHNLQCGAASHKDSCQGLCFIRIQLPSPDVSWRVLLVLVHFMKEIHLKSYTYIYIYNGRSQEDPRLGSALSAAETLGLLVDFLGFPLKLDSRV